VLCTLYLSSTLHSSVPCTLYLSSTLHSSVLCTLCLSSFPSFVRVSTCARTRPRAMSALAPMPLPTPRLRPLRGRHERGRDPAREGRGRTEERQPL
jgi:hypothetical protein